MKNSIFNIKKSGRKGNLLAILLTVTASLLYCTSAFAWSTPIKFLSNVTSWSSSDAPEMTTDGTYTAHYDYYASSTAGTVYFRFYANSKTIGTDGNTEWTPSSASSTGTAKGEYLMYENKGDNLYFTRSNTTSDTEYVKYVISFDGSAGNSSATINVTAYTVEALTASISGSSSVAPGTVVNLTMSATGGSESYTSTFTASDGTLSKSSSSAASEVITWTAPSTPGTYTITNTVSDAVIKKSTKHSDSDYSDVEEFEITVTPSGDAPTVLLAAEPEVSEANATLHGYLKYTGCQNVTDFGFIWSESLSDINQTTPTGTSTAATTPTAPITVGNYGTEFTLSSYEFPGQRTIYYKAYATNGVGTSYSTEYGSFTTEGCVKPVVSAITVPDQICDNAVTITATVTATGTGNTYVWEVDGEVFSAISGTGATATVTVAKAGTGSISVTPTSGEGCKGVKFTDDDITVIASAIKAKNLKYSVDGGEEISSTEGETIQFCQGSSITMKITSDVDPASYSWSIPDSWTVTSGSTSSKSLTATIGASGSSSTISATVTSTCGVSKTRTFIANVTPIPDVPGDITGPATVCKGTEYTYSIDEATAATEYQWVIPAGWTGSCGSVKTELKATPGTDAAASGTIKVKSVNSCGSSAYNSGIDVTVNGKNITITGVGAKNESTTYPWEYMTLTATTDASTVEWSQTYSGSVKSDETVFTTDGKTAKLKSGATPSDTEHYTVTATTTDSGCDVSANYDVYINAAATEVCK